jgi:chemotaxis protein MotB
MAREKKTIEEDIPDGAPEWMVTFSDCMTLLLTFFVLLLSFTSYGDHELPFAGTTLTKSMPSIGDESAVDKDSMKQSAQVKEIEKVSKGSETRPNEEDAVTKFLKIKRPIDYKSLKVFSVASERFFWGDGVAISKDGRTILDALSKFLKRVPSRIVVSENGSDGNNELALSRSLAVLEYMVRQGLNRDNFSITSSGMMLDRQRDHRMLDITLLDPGVYE